MSRIPNSFPEMLDWVEAEQPWAKLPLALVMDCDLTGADFRVYAVIDYRCGKSGQWYGSQAEVARMSGVTERQVRSSVEKFLCKGFLLTRRTGMKTGTVISYAIPARNDRNNSSAPDRNNSSGDSGTTLPVTAEQLFRSSNTDHNTDHNTESLSNESEDAARELRPKKTAITTAFKERMRSTYGPGLADFEEAWAFHLDSSYLRKKLDKQAYMDGRLAAAVKREAERRNQNGNGNRLTGGRRSGAPDAEVHDRTAYGTDALRLRPNFVEG